METKANYVLIGLFTLGVIAGAFGFVYWFNRVGGSDDRATYRIVFEGPVSGLRPGGSVLFNGIRVGEVADLKLDPAAPRRVIAIVAIDKETPVRADTWAGLDYQGLTGIAAISLRGGSNSSPPPPGHQLMADAGASQDVTQAARDMLRKLDSFVSDNEAALRSSLKNIETFSQTLADNSGRVDRILAGAENLLGSSERPGEIALAARAIRNVADNLDRQVADISADLSTFSQTLADNSIWSFNVTYPTGLRSLPINQQISHRKLDYFSEVSRRILVSSFGFFP